MKQKLIVTSLVLALVAASYGGYTLLHRAPISEAKPAPVAPAQMNAQVLRYPVGAPQLAYLKIQLVEAWPEPALNALNGRISYDENHTARVFSPVAGRVARIVAQAGDKVAAGQALLWLDSPDFSAAAADAAKASSAAHLKQLALSRAQTLFDGKVLAHKELEMADDDYQQARAEATRAQAKLHNLNGADSADGLFALRAALAGVVTEWQANPGTEVRPDASTPLFVISDPKHLWAVIDLPEQDIAAVHMGQAISVEVDAYPNEQFNGKIVNVGAALDPATRRIQVRCSVDNSSQKLKPEMYARVTPLADAKNKLPRVANSALVNQGIHNYIFVEKEAGVLERRSVVLGLQGREFSYIKEGLSAGEKVVNSGALLLNSELSGEN
jgi:cobalt-zinc-cadmium efflux system membrane fusion protein